MQVSNIQSVRWLDSFPVHATIDQFLGQLLLFTFSHAFGICRDLVDICNTALAWQGVLHNVPHSFVFSLQNKTSAANFKIYIW